MARNDPLRVEQNQLINFSTFLVVASVMNETERTIAYCEEHVRD
jgi:hypothetical protein